MQEYIKVAVDAMGGDYAPDAAIQGAIEAINANKEIKVYLVGRETLINDKLKVLSYQKDQLEVVHAEEIIEMAEPPVMAIRTKKDSSIVRGMMMVRNGDCDAFVSAGSTGAVLVGGQVLVGRLKGVERPPLAPVIPTRQGGALLVDCGANVDSRASHLVQFAKMGSIYMKNICGIENPRIGLVSVGAEEEKGNALVKETYPLLKNCPDIHFIGNIEARDIPDGIADVIVCDAFVGNVILKMYEGVSSSMMSIIKEGMMSSLRGKIGGALVKPVLKATLKNYSASEYGGAPLLGLKGLIVKAHGNSNALEIKNSILQCVDFTRKDINAQIRDSVMLSDIQGD